LKKKHSKFAEIDTLFFFLFFFVFFGFFFTQVHCGVSFAPQPAKGAWGGPGMMFWGKMKRKKRGFEVFFT
jgi:hypothetical protein